jgi:NAD(P)-dependent dehydrogenase (short-subunit alcohol dehydrogenase family)
MESFALTGKRVLVTGASSGLGAHFAQLLISRGAEVTIAARRVQALGELARRLELHGKVRCLELDVANADSRAALVEQAGPIDVLVNNAGVVRESAALTHTEDDWDTVMDTNLKGMFFLAQAVARNMRQQGGGNIVNVASVLGLRQAAGVISYTVSKAGVIQLTKALASEWARHGIRVNALAPGYIDTEINGDFWQTERGQALVKRIPQRRLGQPQDLDGPLLLLCSDASRYMTGSVLAVDGGHLVSTL